MKLCVVGGTGHISTPLVQGLVAQGHAVTCFTRGQRAPVPPGARLLQGDRQQRRLFERTMRAERFDAAIDMICFTREDALSSVRAFPAVQHFVQCSTVCTYGLEYEKLPVTEAHPLRPYTPYGQHKAEADAVFLDAYERQGFPVTILKPSTTYGPTQGLLRQIAWDLAWLDRIRKGKPLLVCDEGRALHQHLHVEDAAWGFTQVLGKAHCVGQTYNLVSPECLSWAEYHRTAMRVLGREVALVSVPLAAITADRVPRSEICREIFAHPTTYSGEKLGRAVPEFRPRIALEAGMRQVIGALEGAGRIPNSDLEDWEERLIAESQGHGRARDT
jgi:nucleoside-diphosphate-sugar epimerase